MPSLERSLEPGNRKVASNEPVFSHANLEVLRCYPPQKLTAKAPEKLGIPKRKCHLPTIDFQGLAPLVSGSLTFSSAVFTTLDVRRGESQVFTSIPEADDGSMGA